MKSSLSIDKLTATIFSEKHASVDFHVKGDEARVNGSHFPRRPKAHREQEFFSLAVGVDNVAVNLYLDRETLEGIAFTARELLDQSVGIADGAESLSVQGLPIREERDL